MISLYLEIGYVVAVWLLYNDKPENRARAHYVVITLFMCVFFWLPIFIYALYLFLKARATQ